VEINMTSADLDQLEAFVGPGLQVLLHNRQLTEAYLDEKDAKMRWAAVVLLTYHWSPTNEFKDKCQYLALHDPDNLVRSKAIGSLGACFAGTGNRRVENLLGTLVANEDESYTSRRSAYAALFRVHGSGPVPPAEKMLNLRIPEDIDWGFISSMKEKKE
jgi:hypothetical protein